MQLSQIVSRLKEQGVALTGTKSDQEKFVKEQLSGLSIQLGEFEQYEPEIVEHFQTLIGSIQTASPSFEITASNSSIQKVDPNHLPEVSTLSNSEVAEWIGKVEQMQSQGKVQDDRIIQFLGELYNHRQQAIEFSRSAAQAFQKQDAALLDASEQLNNAITTSLKTLQQNQQLQSALAGEGVSQLAANFRASDDLLGRFNRLTGNHPEI